MIVYQVWNARDNAPSITGTGNSAQSTSITRLDSVMRITIDSGLGYTLVSLTLFFSYVARSNALYITSGAVSLLSLVMYPNTMTTLHVFWRTSRPWESHSILLTSASQIWGIRNKRLPRSFTMEELKFPVQGVQSNLPPYPHFHTNPVLHSLARAELRKKAHPWLKCEGATPCTLRICLDRRSTRSLSWQDLSIRNW